MTATDPYFYTSVVFALPVGKPFTAFQKLFLPFKYKIWFIVTMMFVIGFIVIAILNHRQQAIRNFVLGSRNRVPYLNMISIFLTGECRMLPKRNFARVLVIIWMLACLVLRNSYQGALFQFLQKAKLSSPPNTIDELIEANYTLYLISSSYYIVEHMPRTHKL